MPPPTHPITELHEPSVSEMARVLYLLRDEAGWREIDLWIYKSYGFV